MRWMATAMMAPLLAGCFELENAVVINKDGSARWNVQMVFSEALISTLQTIADDGEDPLDEARAMWKIDAQGAARALEHGLRVDKMDISSDGRIWTSQFSGDSLSAFRWQSVAVGMEDEPEESAYSISENTDGTLTVVTASPGDMSALDGLLGPDGGPKEEPTVEEAIAELEAEKAEEEDEPEMNEEQLQKMMGLLGGLMSEMQNIKMTNSITVPGKVVEGEPSVGFTVKKSTATWTWSMAEIMAFGMNPTPVSVTFKPKGKSKAALLP